MKFKCYKCWFKNDKDVYKCLKCWEIFWISENKYKAFLKEKEMKEKEYKLDLPLKPNYKRAKIISRIPFWVLMINWRQNHLTDQFLIIVAIKWLFLSFILIVRKKFVIKYAEKGEKSESFVSISMFISLILLFLITYVILK